MRQVARRTFMTASAIGMAFALFVPTGCSDRQPGPVAGGAGPEKLNAKMKRRGSGPITASRGPARVKGRAGR